MPTWPTTTISTSNLDAGSDRPSLARADIKSMADVVNELVNYGAPTSSPYAVHLTINTTEQQISGATYRKTVTEEFDNGNLCTLSDSNYRFTLLAGSYFCLGPFARTVSSDFYVDTYLYNYSTSADVKVFNKSNYTVTTATYVPPGNQIFTVSTDTIFEIRTLSRGSSGSNAMLSITFIKLA